MSTKQSLWEEERQSILRYSHAPAEILEDFLDLLELMAETVGELDLNSFKTTWKQAGHEDPPASVHESIAELIKKLKGSALVVRTPSPAAHSSKLQLTVQDGVYDLLNNWAAAENRDIPGLAVVALEKGLRALVAEGVVPQCALDAYESQCRERIGNAYARAGLMQFLKDVDVAPF